MHRYWLVVIGASLLGFLSASPPVLAAALIDPFSRDGIDLDSREWTMIKESVRKVLDAYQDGSQASWENPASGRAGQAKITRIYQAKGLKCAEVEHTFTKGTGNRYVLPFCQVADGSWKVAF
jgi:surface antigen